MTDTKETLVRRIDRGTVSGTTEDMLAMCLNEKDKTHFLFRIGGEAVGYTEGTGKYGVWEKLVGRFKAINAQGNIFKAGALFLPGDGGQMVVNKLKENDTVTFLFDIFVRYDSTLATKYAYITEPVRKPTDGDPLDLLFNDVKAIPMLSDQSAT